jgi:uncharacterized membrane protein HdeD (DUF308 family)
MNNISFVLLLAVYFFLMWIVRGKIQQPNTRKFQWYWYVASAVSAYFGAVYALDSEYRNYFSKNSSEQVKQTKI